MNFVAKLVFAAAAIVSCHVCLAAASDIGAVVIHGKWGSAAGPIAPLVTALRDQGYLVSAPDMPWSAARQYDATVERADEEVDAEIARLKNAGAKSVFVIGHSLGAAFTMHFVTRASVSGIVLIAPGHRVEAAAIVQRYAEDVRKARDLVAEGKGDEHVGFTDFNTGDRRSYLRASATSFVSYFDPAGPLNMQRNVESFRPDVPVLWLEPTGEEQPLRNAMIALAKHLPRNSLTRFEEPAADHLGAPALSAKIVVDWMREVAAR